MSLLHYVLLFAHTQRTHRFTAMALGFGQCAVELNPPAHEVVMHMRVQPMLEDAEDAVRRLHALHSPAATEYIVLASDLSLSWRRRVVHGPSPPAAPCSCHLLSL